MQSQPPFRLGEITVEPSLGLFRGPGGELRAEPKVVDLLLALKEAEGGVVSREALFERVWTGVTVGEDTLTRAVFKLRRALGDDPKSPRFIETVPKRGYRLMVDAEPLEQPPPKRRRGRRPALFAGVAAGLALLLGVVLWPGDGPGSSAEVQRATDRYMRFTRTDNEAAIALYQRALSHPRPEPEAEAGLAAALVQRVVRWPEALGSEQEGAANMRTALSSGLTETPEARETLRRARALAERSVRRAPRNADAWRILGLVRTAQGEIDGAFTAYEKALAIDPENWGVRINLSELQAMRGEEAEAYATLVSAYDAMGPAYLREPQRVGPWRAPLGVLIAGKNVEAGRLDEAEGWFRRVLRDEPYDRAATLDLSKLLTRTGRDGEARSLCGEFRARTGDESPCPA